MRVLRGSNPLLLYEASTSFLRVETIVEASHDHRSSTGVAFYDGLRGSTIMYEGERLVEIDKF